jgi:hypothetical protein
VGIIEELLSRRFNEAECDGKDAHERSVAVAVLIIVTRSFGTGAAGEPDNRASGGSADIEHLAPRRPVSFLVPSDEPLSHVVEIKSGKEALDGAERQGAVI